MPCFALIVSQASLVSLATMLVQGAELCFFVLRPFPSAVYHPLPYLPERFASFSVLYLLLIHVTFYAFYSFRVL